MNTHPLTGLDGQHLWGFLSALGALSLLDDHANDEQHEPPRLSFSANYSAVLHCIHSESDVTRILLAKLQSLSRMLDQAFRDIDRPGDFTKTSFDRVAYSGSAAATGLLAGLACIIDDEAAESTLCAANGAGHQHLIQSMRDVLHLVEQEHLHDALFHSWTRSFSVPEPSRKALKLGSRKPTLRLDPADERLYALRLNNPTTDGHFSTELGAQALAIPAFGLLPVVPQRHPVTVSSHRSRQRVTFSWLLWSDPATLHTARSVAWAGIEDAADRRARGCFAAFSADRLSGSKGKLSFAPSQGVW